MPYPRAAEPTPSITAADAHPKASNYHRCRHTYARVELPRIGFDRMMLSAPRATRILPPWPASMGEYKRRCNQHSKRDAYARRAMYRHIADSSAPVVEIFYEPTKPFRPRFRVVFRASMMRLLDLDQVSAVLAFVRAHTGVVPVLSELEVTLDFAPRRASELRRLYAPRRQTHKCGGTWYWGTRKSATSIRAYLRPPEDGMVSARVEVIARRDFLRKWHVNNLDDLRAVRWSTLVGPMLRFVTVDPHGRCSPQERAEFDASFRMIGVSATLKALPRARRERLRRQLRPAPISLDVRRLLAGLDARQNNGGAYANPSAWNAVA